MASLADIRARLAAQDNKQTNNYSQGESAIYAHWNIPDGTTAILRFLEDADPENPYFWAERAMFKLPFNGIKGDPQSKRIIVQVPCMEMYGESCPVLNEVRPWFKDDSLEEMGRTYWKKRSYLFQGFVRSDPMNEEAKPENPIRRYMISPQIFKLIKNSLMDPEIENLPTDIENGLDFKVNKEKDGDWADYGNSSWSRKESPLTDDERAAIDEHGLFNLKEFLPAKPTPEVQKVIMEMFEASVDGEAYDPDRWAAYYTPPGMARTGGSNSSNDSKAANHSAGTTANVDKVDDAVVTPATIEAVVADAVVEEKADSPVESSGNAKAQDILAKIRARTAS